MCLWLMYTCDCVCMSLCFVTLAQTQLPSQVPKKLPKPNTTPKEISEQEQTKIDWVKETKGLANNIQKDTNLFMSWKFKGHSLLGDKQSGVTKELMAAIENGLKQLQAQGGPSLRS